MAFTSFLREDPLPPGAQKPAPQQQHQQPQIFNQTKMDLFSQPNAGLTSKPLTTIAAPTATTTGGSATTGAFIGGSGSRVQSSLGGHNNLLQQLFDDMRQIEDTVDSIEIPARGRCKVYIAKYGYDPFKQSPNDNPDAELAFDAGEYIMVFDDIDEDGYFIGELMDGRRGYVPSNWLDRLTGEDLFEFQATTLYKGSNNLNSSASGNANNLNNSINGNNNNNNNFLDDDSEINSYPPEFYDAVANDSKNHTSFQHFLLPADYHRMNDYVDLDDVNEVDDECLSDYERAEAEQMRRAVPPPQRLVIERQLNKSILIGWLHPQAAKGTIVSYQVYVDGVLKSTVPSGDRTKALLEGVDSIIPHRISVRAIDLSGRHSNDAGCTIVIGQQVPFAPSCVKASHITSDSALISWLPCNSNFHHVVAVNSVEVQTVRPGVYKHLINGLSANTMYRVWVRAKPGKILSIDEKNPKKLESLTTSIDFQTMPKSLPDPPVNIQVGPGPQTSTLLVTWLPLTLNEFKSSNGCAVTGYAVFAGHKKLADIESPTGDHALLDLSDLESLHKKSVTVRTKSGENLSQDSMPCQIPDEYLRPLTKQHDHQHQSSNHHHHHHQRASSGVRHGLGGANFQNRLSDSNIHNNQHSSPIRHPTRYNISSSSDHNTGKHLQATGRSSNSRYASNNLRGRQLTRSMQNLESDLDSRRSSIPAIEITRETSVSDQINPTESFSEEEFENSMRFRGIRGHKQHSGINGRQISARLRGRQPNSVDGSRNPAMQTGAKLRANPSDIRYFVALFDYDPSTMSPNPNAASEELAFKEGSIIKVIGDKGADGFYRGELDNHVGYVPCNVVSEITDPNLLYNLTEKHNLNRQQLIQQQQQQQSNYLSQQQPNSRQPNQILAQASDPQQQQQQVGGVKRMTALYDYDPQENSPNADTESEIPFKVGDVIYVYGKMDTDGFYMGEVERTKQRGLVPSNFLREDPLPAGAQKLPQMFNQTLMDPFQQQQQQRPVASQQPNQQFIGGAMQQAGAALDPSMAFGGQQAMQANQQQQQQMGKVQNNQSQMRTNIRGNLPVQGQRGMVEPMLQQNISRPTTLSLGPNSSQQMGDWNNQQQNRQQQQLHMQQQQQPQQQFQSNVNPLGNPLMGQQQQQAPQIGGFGGLMQGQQQQPGVMQMQQQPQSQGMLMNNQPAGSGVLSNLLSSGKQIIGAATTPRNPNQPNQFPSINSMNPNMGNMAPNMSGVGMGERVNLAMQNSQQNVDLTSSSQQIPISSFNMPHSTATSGLIGNQMHLPQQQQHFNQMARAGPMNQMGAEEQGGNILNTVKNMFKL